MQKTPDEIVAQAREIARAEAQAVKGLVKQLDTCIIEVLNLLLTCPGHVLVTGAGTSHAVAQRFAHLLSCSGTPSLCIDAADALHGGAGAITPNDVVYIISKGGHSDEVNQFARIAKSRGAIVIAQTENVDSPLAQMSDEIFRIVSPSKVDPYGMVATGSSLVNSAAGAVLCALLLDLRGYTRAAFAATHPGGAVGEKIKHNQAIENAS